MVQEPPEDDNGFAFFLAKGLAAWPRLRLDAAVFKRYLKDRLAAGPVAPEDAALAADLFLACACLHKVPGSIEAFLAALRSQLEDIARRYDPSPAFADEVRQQLCDTLFVGKDGTTPKIGNYAGTGSLSGWVGISAKRMALRLRANGAGKAGIAVSRLDDVVPGTDAPGVLEKSRHKGDFENAVRTALESLPPRAKVVLRLSTVDRVSEKKIAIMYRVHQSTVSRWKTEAHEFVREETKKYLRERGKLPASEVDSFIRLLHTQADITLSRILSPSSSGGGDSGGGEN